MRVTAVARGDRVLELVREARRISSFSTWGCLERMASRSAGSCGPLTAIRSSS